MRDHAAAMSTYAQLAVISQAKHQALARDRFVLLAGVEACRAGWLDVAQACYAFHTQHAIGHRLQDYPALTAALQDAEFRQIVEQTERWCHHERAEAMLRGLSFSPEPSRNDVSIGEWTLKVLQELDVTPVVSDSTTPRTEAPNTNPLSGE